MRNKRLLISTTKGKDFNYSKFTEKLISERGNVMNFAIRQDDGIVPHPDNRFNLYYTIYNKVPAVKNAFSKKAYFAIQNGHELEGDPKEVKKCREWEDLVDFDVLAVKIMKKMQIQVNAYYENESNKILPEELMYVRIDDNENIIGYLEKTTFDKKIFFKKNEIVHFKWNDVNHPFYGTSDIIPVMGPIASLVQYQEDIGEIIHRYANVKRQWKLGHDGGNGLQPQPATQEDIDNFKATLDALGTGEDLVTSTGVKCDLLVPNIKMIQPEGLIKHLENQLMTGLGIPDTFIRGGESSNKATADVELQGLDREVKALRKVFSTYIEDYIFKDYLGCPSVKFAWHEMNTESEVQKADTFKKYVDGGIPPKVALRMVGMPQWIDDYENEIKNSDNNDESK